MEFFLFSFHHPLIYLDFLPQLFCISLYAFFETVDFFFGFDVPFFFFALILLTNEFFTPSLFLPSFAVAPFIGGLGADFFLGRPGLFFLVVDITILYPSSAKSTPWRMFKVRTREDFTSLNIRGNHGGKLPSGSRVYGRPIR